MWMQVYKLNILILQMITYSSFHISTPLVIVGDYINK